MANKYTFFWCIVLLGGCIEIPPAPPSRMTEGQAGQGNAPSAGTQSSTMGGAAPMAGSVVGGQANTPGGQSGGTQSSTIGGTAPMAGSVVGGRANTVGGESAGSMSTGGRITALGGELSGGQNSSGGVMAGTAGDMVAGSPGSTGGSGASAGSAAGGNPAPTCDDGVRNGAETDVDCGGGCAPCAEGQACRIGQDCVAGICNDLNVCMPPLCNDGIKNGREAGIDCGGTCDGCPPGSPCSVGRDCESISCVMGLCTAPTCDDGLQNGAETGVDCGPSDSGCAKCADGTACQNGNECESLVCVNQQCIAPRCDDGVSNGDETDIDCGGPVCERCGQERQCVQNSDCVSGQCFIWMPGPGNNDPQPNICLPPAQLGESCEGGPEDVLCDEGLVCDDVGQRLCVLPHCVNNFKDADETDINCGGAGCAPCASRMGCLVNGDCVDGSLCLDATLTCGPAHCQDGQRNGNETDVDCGGGECPGCGAGLMCRFIRDCGSQNCLGAVDDGSMEGQCADHCADGMINGGETGTDCGGPCGKTCQIGDPCLRDDDCSGILTCNLDGVAPRENGGCLPPG